MAEYIGREVAKKMLEEYRISRTMSMYGDMDHLMEWREGVKCSMKKLDEVPTADVVPKSELEKAELDVEVLGAELSRYTENLMQMREQDKRNIAREIFEEIETCMKDFEDDDDGYLLKKCEFEFFMREIKEKYAEQKNG